MKAPGDFSFIKCDLWRETLTHDYASLTREGWHALKHHDSTKSFMLDTNGPIWDSIRAKMYDGHSGASMACSLRTLEQIAKSGWNDFVRRSESGLEQSQH